MSQTPKFIIALDQGTTSSRAVLYNTSGCELKISSRPLQVRFPSDGWVEQDPKEIWNSQCETLKEVSAGIAPADIAAIGITNQRETTVCWDPEDGQALAPAIVWQCRRSAEICRRLKLEAGLEEIIRQKTGLVIDAYFSASKIQWLLENISGLKERVAKGRGVFGTVDSWLIFNLTAGTGRAVFRTEPSNASRTMLFSLNSNSWDSDLLERFGIPKHALAEVVDSDAEFGRTNVLGGSVPICGVLGDQQASLFGNACFEAGSSKCTFGTGAFLLVNTGDKLSYSEAGLISTIASRLRAQGSQYAIEGSAFIAGALIQWLRDKLGIIKSAADTAELARSVQDSGGVTLVPAFVGLGAPYWDDSARGCLLGLTRDTSAAHIVRAAFEGIAQQVADILHEPLLKNLAELRVDGGMSRNSVFCQILSDITGVKIRPSPLAEMTAFGAASVACLGAGLFPDIAALEKGFSATGHGVVYEPKETDTWRNVQRQRWEEAVQRSRGWTLV